MEEQPTESELTDFKYQVSEWIKLDEQIRKLQIAIKERKTIQTAYSTSIQDFMKKHGYENLNTQQGTIKASTREHKVPIKLTEIKTTLFSLENETLPIREVIKKIFEQERPTVQKSNLRRIVPKVNALDI